MTKYFSFFNNKLLASWIAHITMDFISCYSCSYYSSMLQHKRFPVNIAKFLRTQILKKSATGYFKQQWRTFACQTGWIFYVMMNNHLCFIFIRIILVLLLLYLYSVQKQSYRCILLKVFLKDFAKFTKKTPVTEHLFQASLATLFRKKLRYMCFPVNFEFWKASILLTISGGCFFVIGCKTKA